MVSADMGAVVPVDDSAAIAAALRRLLRDDRVLRRARAASARLGEQLSWPTVARRMANLVSTMTTRREPRTAVRHPARTIISTAPAA
jgi:glycosyltransferase involved in cell wall biosynthesis